MPAFCDREECQGQCSILVNYRGTTYCPLCHRFASPVLCHNCSDSIGDGHLTTNDTAMCRYCYATRYQICGDCGLECRCRGPFDGIFFCDDCNHHHHYHCAWCDDSVERSEGTRENGMFYCSPCYNERTFGCHQCNARYPIEDQVESSELCQSCLYPRNWGMKPFRPPTTTLTDIRSARKFGVEIETSACPEHWLCRENVIFGCKEDGSVDGKEFVSPVLWGDEGLAEVTAMCAEAQRLDFQLDSACGLHIHFDVQEETTSGLFAIALAYHYTYDFWTSFISDSRKHNYYCSKHTYTPTDVPKYQDDFARFVEYAATRDRYRWLNVQAYYDHGSFEIRNHNATLNAVKINNWIKAHTRFMDAVSAMSIAEISQELGGTAVAEVFAFVSNIWDDEDLTSFYLGRAAGFNKPICRERMLVNS